MITTTTSPVTARWFLFGNQPFSDTVTTLDDRLRRDGVSASAVHGLETVAEGGRRAVDRELGSTLTQLTEIDLGDGLLIAWRAHRRLQDAARETLDHPGSSVVVPLAEHRVSSAYRPHVDLVLDGVLLHRFEIALTLTADITGFAAVVRYGELHTIEAGSCALTLDLGVDEVTVARRERTLDARLVVRLQRPWPLLTKVRQIPPAQVGPDRAADAGP